MISHECFRAPSFRWLLAWAVLLCFGASGTAYGQTTCPPNNNPPPILGLGAGPGNTDRSFGYSGSPDFNTPNSTLLGPGAGSLINKIGITLPRRIIKSLGDVRAIAVQRVAPNANKFIVAGDFEYRVPFTNIVYRNIMRLDLGGAIDTTFVPPPAFFSTTTGINPDPGPINALAVDSQDRIVVGGAFTAPLPRLLRLQPNGALDPGFTPPPPTGPVLALEVQPVTLVPPVGNALIDSVYIGLDGSIGTRPFFTRLLPNGAPDSTLGTFWGPQTLPNFQTSINGPVRAIKYVTAGPFLGTTPGVVIGGTFGVAGGGIAVSNIVVGNIAFFDAFGSVDNLFPGINTAANGTVNALAVDNSTNPTTVYAGGEFTQFNGIPRPRVAKFSVAGLDTFFDPPNPPANPIPNPVRALVLTRSNFTAPPSFPPPPPGTFTILHVGGTQTQVPPNPPGSASVGLDVINGLSAPSLTTQSPFFATNNPAVVFAMAASNVSAPNGGALFGGDFFGDGASRDGEKLAATFNVAYNPTNGLPVAGGLPSFVFLKGDRVGPTQFYASALLPNGDLLIGGDVGSDTGLTPLGADGNTVELYRISTCGDVSVVARFRNVSGYLVRNDIDNGSFVGPQDDINTTPGMGFRRVDRADPASIRAIAVDPQGRIYVGGQFNQVLPGSSGTPVPWNNLVRLNSDGTIDPLFQVGQDDPTPPPGYTPIRKGGPTGFGAPGVGFTTVDPERILPSLTGNCEVPPVYPGTPSDPTPTSPVPGTGEKYNPNEGRVNAIVLQPDGRVLIGGEFKCYNEVPRGGIARLTATGSLDPTFGESSFSLPGVGDYLLCGNPGGSAVVGVPRNNPAVSYNRARVNAILLEPDGKVVVGGLFARANNVDRYNIARFNSDGTLDTGFSQGPTGSIFPTGTSGLGATPATGPNNGPTSNGRGGEIFAMARQSTGRILIGGAFDRILNQTGGASNLARTAFTRLESNGRHDATFAQLNFTAVPAFAPPAPGEPPAPASATVAIVRAIAVRSDDRPLIGGPFLIGNRNLVPFDGIGYINNTVRARIHRTGINGEFEDFPDSFGVPRATFLAVPPGVGQNPNAPLVFQPGPYAVSLPVGFGGFPPVPGSLGSLASIFAPGSFQRGVGSPPITVPAASNGPVTHTSEISYYPNLPFNTTPPFGNRFLDTRMTVNTITLDPARRRAYIGGLFNTFESVRADFQNDSAGALNGLNLDIRWPAVAALQNGSGCTYGLVRPSFPPFQPIPVTPASPPPPPVSLGPVSPAGVQQLTIATLTRSAVSLCDVQPTISTNANFVTIVGAVPRTTNPAFVDIIINIAANNTGTQRSGSATAVTVGVPVEGVSPSSYPTVTFTFDQNPLPSGCTYTVTASQTSFPLAGGTGSFTITTGTGCPWSVGTLPSWISASPTSGSGNGTVNFTVAANSGAPRSATVTVAGQNFTITQAGTCTLTLGPVTGTPLPIPVTGGTGSFTVTTSSGCTYTATSSAPWLVITGGASGGPTGTVTFSVGRNSGAPRSATITVTTTGTPPQTQTVTVSQNADIGPNTADTVGMFRPSNGFFYLRFSNTSGNADIDFFYGTANDVPLSGDWDGDGITTIGIFRNGQFFLRNSNSAGFATVPAFAIDGTQPGDIPVAGDWDGNGTTTAGLFRGGVFLLRNSNTAGPADVIINYALPTDTPIVGDWDGDGVTTIGLYRAGNAFFALRNTNSSGAPDLQFFFGNPNDVPVAGDWNGNGFTTIGVFRTGTFFLRNSNSSGPADLTVNYGVPTDRPVIGKWQ